MERRLVPGLANMFRKHFNDALLMAHLDGEVSRAAARTIEQHLGSCWQCRARQAELEAQAERTAAAYARAVSFALTRTHEARQKFHIWAGGVAAPERFAAPAPPHPSLPVRWKYAVAASVLVSLAMLGYFSQRKPAGPGAERIAALAERSESQLLENTVHQIMYVEIAETRPARRRIGGPLEIWSDLAHGRYASRWKLDDGTLRFARWQPGAGRHFRWDARTARTQPVADVGTSPISLCDGEPAGEDLEVRFLEWLESRRWQPLLLTRELLKFAAKAGSTLEVERVRSRAGRDVFRIAAVRRTAHLNVEVMAEVAARDFMPQLLWVRFETGGRCVEIRLTVKSNERVPPMRLTASVFEPDLRPAPPRRLRPPIPKNESVAAGISEPPPIDAATLNEVEIEVYYALHRLGACKGDAVEVRRTDWRIVVEGAVRDAERKQQLLAGLSRITPAAAVLRRLTAIPEIPSSDGGPQTGKSATRDNLVGRGPARLEAEIELDEYLAQHPAAGKSAVPGAAEFTAIANEAFKLNGALMDDAWAMRRLAARYRKADAPALSRHSQDLLIVMAREHAVSLRRSVLRMGQLLAPLTSLMALPPVHVTAAIPAAAGPQDWTGPCDQLYEAARRLQTVTQALFAGGGMYLERNGRVFMAEQAGQGAGISLRDLPEALSGLDADAVLLLARMDTRSADAMPPSNK
ncbi:MAG: hypothetical protein M1541_20960 [Acidobacteria bacterium]|nr:hypothetical protein [Acidobacteriota bacterium]